MDDAAVPLRVRDEARAARARDAAQRKRLDDGFEHGRGGPGFEIESHDPIVSGGYGAGRIEVSEGLNEDDAFGREIAEKSYGIFAESARLKRLRDLRLTSDVYQHDAGAVEIA